MSEHGVEMILGMAQDLNERYQAGLKEGIKIGRREVFIEISKLLKGEENGNPGQ